MDVQAVAIANPERGNKVIATHRESLIVELDGETSEQRDLFRGKPFPDQLCQTIKGDLARHEQIDALPRVLQSDLDHDVARFLLAQNLPNATPATSVRGTATKAATP